MLRSKAEYGSMAPHVVGVCGLRGERGSGRQRNLFLGCFAWGRPRLQPAESADAADRDTSHGCLDFIVGLGV